MNIEFDHQELKVASIEDLIALKIFAGGPKDLEDARGVIEVNRTHINTELLMKLCNQFGKIEAETCSVLLEQKT